MKKEYIVFWTCKASYADTPKRVFGRNPWKAIVNSWFWVETDLQDRTVRFLVFEVGSNLVHDGTIVEAYDKFESEHTGLKSDATCKCGQWPIEEYGERCPSCDLVPEGIGVISSL
jgi:hypothetical protein